MNYWKSSCRKIWPYWVWQEREKSIKSGRLGEPVTVVWSIEVVTWRGPGLQNDVPLTVAEFPKTMSFCECCGYRIERHGMSEGPLCPREGYSWHIGRIELPLWWKGKVKTHGWKWTTEINLASSHTSDAVYFTSFARIDTERKRWSTIPEAERGTLKELVSQLMSVRTGSAESLCQRQDFHIEHQNFLWFVRGIPMGKPLRDFQRLVSFRSKETVNSHYRTASVWTLVIKVLRVLWRRDCFGRFFDQMIVPCFEHDT